MVEVQNHGFLFENWIKKVLGVDNLAQNYTQKWDVPGKIPVSVKLMGMKNALEFGSAVRIWEIDEPFTLVVGRWEQVGTTKVVRSIDEITITPSILNELKGRITLEELKQFDETIKHFVAGKGGQQRGIEYAKKWKKERENKMGLLTITHKIDSKNQRRIQCNLNYENYVSLFGEPSTVARFRGQEFVQSINHGPRKFKRGNQK